MVKFLIRRFRIVIELINFLWENKLWWLIPLVLILLLFAFLMIFGTATGIGPFIYTLF